MLSQLPQFLLSGLTVERARDANTGHMLLCAFALAAGLGAFAGTFNFTPGDPMGLDQSAFRMLEVKHGGWVLIQ